jgi:osmotically inducible protein OsmC
MALAFLLRGAGFVPAELSTEPAVSLDPESAGLRIGRSALTLRAKVPNLDEATFTRPAEDAEQNCPVSKALKAEIILEPDWCEDGAEPALGSGAHLQEVQHESV